MAANYKIIALQVGDLIKYTTSFNEINRAAQSVCSFQLQEFPQYKSLSVLLEHTSTFAGYLPLLLKVIYLFLKEMKFYYNSRICCFKKNKLNKLIKFLSKLESLQNVKNLIEEIFIL